MFSLKHNVSPIKWLKTSIGNLYTYETGMLK